MTERIKIRYSGCLSSEFEFGNYEDGDNFFVRFVNEDPEDDDVIEFEFRDTDQFKQFIARGEVAAYSSLAERISDGKTD